MSAIVLGYPQTSYPSLNSIYPPHTLVAPYAAGPAGFNLQTSSDALQQHFSNVSVSPDTQHEEHGSPSKPTDSQTRLKALAKSVTFFGPAIFIASLGRRPKEVAQSFLPSDWRIWAKIGLGIAGINQANKALNWSPPPWLGAFLNVTVMAGLMTGLTRNSAKTIALVGPWLAALVQGTHYVDDKLEAPLQEKFNIPPVATKIGLSVLSMGAGMAGLPKLMALAEPEVEASTLGSEKAANTRALSTGSCSCCAGSPICLTEVSNNATLALTQFQKHIHHSSSPDHPQKEAP